MRNGLKTAISGAAVTALTLAGTVAATSPVGATTGILMLGSAAGGYVRALNSTVSSDVTAQSGLNTFSSSASSTNSAAAVNVQGLVSTAAVSTSTKITPVTGGKQMVSEVKTAGVNLLSGLITVQAIDTVNTITIVNGVASADVNTTFVGLKVANLHIPVVIPKNFGITIPGVVSISINQALAGAVGGEAEAIGNGLAVTLLKARAGQPAGVSAYVSSTFGAVVNFDAPNTGHSIGGEAYGTSVHAAVGTLVDVRSDPTAPIFVPLHGTNGGPPVTSSTAAVNLNPVLKIGAITDTAEGVNTTARGEAHTTSTIASINLLNGLIKAGAITSSATANAPTGSPTTVSGSSQLVNLVIAGHPISINTAPNTVITIPNIATITINQQLATPFSITVRALDITLLNPQSNLPAGAEIQVAVASAAAN